MDKIKNVLKNEKARKIAIIIVCIIILILAFSILWLNNDQSNTEVIDVLSQMEEEITESNETEESGNTTNEIEEETNQIVVHITGEVKNAGIVYLESGARIADAIEAAGGATEDADLDQVNLAYLLEDGQKIYIPNKNEEIEQGEYIISDSGENVIEESSSAKEVSGKVNINTATQEELETLTGIGSVLAQRIIEYREENGNFESIEDIKNVKGIGDSKYSDIKDSICI